MNQQKIGKFLKELRKERTLTQEQLAEHFGVSGRTVSRWETGSNMPDLSTLVIIADFFDVDIREIIDGERKSEKMDEKMRETVLKVANYADEEKAVLLKRVRVTGIIGMVACFIAIVLELSTFVEHSYLFNALSKCLWGLSLGVLTINVLFTSGLLSKIKSKKKHS